MIKIYYLNWITRSARLRIKLQSMKNRAYQIIKKKEIEGKKRRNICRISYFSKERHGAYWFSFLKSLKMTRTALFRLNAIEFWFWFSKERTLIFVRLKLRAALFRVYSLNSFAGFITFVVNLYYIWVHYYICGQLLHLWFQHGLFSSSRCKNSVLN